MSVRTKILAAAIGGFVAPALACAQTRDIGPGAYAAASKSARATRPAPRSRISQPADASAGRLSAADSRNLGTDPDANIRFQLRRDRSGGAMHSGGGM